MTQDEFKAIISQMGFERGNGWGAEVWHNCNTNLNCDAWISFDEEMREQAWGHPNWFHVVHETVNFSAFYVWLMAHDERERDESEMIAKAGEGW